MCSAFLRAAAVLALMATSTSARELRVCADPNNLPFSNERGEGFENRIAAVVADQMHAEVRTTWWAQRRGFLRNTLGAGRCDVVVGTLAGLEMLRTTSPYYRSGYVFVTRAADNLDIASLDDPRLHTLRVGVQLIGDDGMNTPPAHALSRRGITGNVRGYTVYGDYAQANPAGRIVAAVAAREVDVAIVWGPFAGYFARRQGEALDVRPVTPQIDGPMLPMVFDISMGVRREDEVLRGEIEEALKVRRPEIDAILASYGVPRLDPVEGTPR
jgi:mxaJ protein